MLCRLRQLAMICTLSSNPDSDNRIAREYSSPPEAHEGSQILNLPGNLSITLGKYSSRSHLHRDGSRNISVEGTVMSCRKVSRKVLSSFNFTVSASIVLILYSAMSRSS